MNEKQIRSLGFKKESVSEEESGSSAYYYYSLEVGDITLITNENDTVKGESGWVIRFLDSNTFQTMDYEIAKSLVNILKSSRI